MKPGYLLYLAAIGEHGSFVRAAEALHISQPALSLSVQRIEELAGTNLVDRGRKGARLTPAGEMLARRGLEIQGALTSAAEEIDLFKQGISGKLRVGGATLSTNIMIPEIIKQILAENSDVVINIIDGVDEELLDMLSRNELDVVLSAPGQKANLTSIQSQPLFRAKTVLVVRNDHPLQSRTEVSLAELNNELWAIPPEGGAFRKQLEALFTTNEIPFPNRIIEAASLPILTRIIRTSNAITLAAAQVIHDEMSFGQLSYLNVKEVVALRAFSIHTRAEGRLSSLCERFCTIASELAPAFDMPVERKSKKAERHR
jgi:LysR family pca operon transcriptional activator